MLLRVTECRHCRQAEGQRNRDGEAAGIDRNGSLLWSALKARSALAGGLQGQVLHDHGGWACQWRSSRSKEDALRSPAGVPWWRPSRPATGGHRRGGRGSARRPARRAAVAARPMTLAIPTPRVVADILARLHAIIAGGLVMEQHLPATSRGRGLTVVDRTASERVIRVQGVASRRRLQGRGPAMRAGIARQCRSPSDCHSCERSRARSRRRPVERVR